MATVVNLQEPKRTLASLAKRAAAGEEILIANRGAPIARLTSLGGKKGPWGILNDKIRIAKDFDEPLDVFSDYSQVSLPEPMVQTLW